MVVGIIGENCTGKSTLARAVASLLGATVVSGKDYLRLAKTESEATTLFGAKLREAMDGVNLIYVISEPYQVQLLPDGAVKVLVTADLDAIKARFAARMHGVLPPPVAQMLERKHGLFDEGRYDYRYHSGTDDPQHLLDALRRYAR